MTHPRYDKWAMVIIILINNKENVYIHNLNSIKTASKLSKALESCFKNDNYKHNFCVYNIKINF
jgi:hypothetical protein